MKKGILKEIIVTGSLALAGSSFYSGHIPENTVRTLDNYVTVNPSTNAYISLMSINYFDALKKLSSFEKIKGEYEKFKKSQLEEMLKEEEKYNEQQLWKKGFYLTQDSLNKVIKQAYKNVKVWPKEFDKRLFRLLILQESSRNIYAENKKSEALGLGQIVPITYKTFRPEKWESFTNPETGEFDFHAYKKELFNPVTNIELSLEALNFFSNYCAKNYPDWKGLNPEERRSVILACYNAGQETVKDLGWDLEAKKLPKETKNYYKKILTMYNNPKIKINTGS